MRTLVLTLCAILTTACGSTYVCGGTESPSSCTERIAAAKCTAETDAPTCNFAPEALERRRCGRADNRPELQYSATFCNLATLECIESGDARLPSICLGDDDSGLDG